MTEPNDTKAVAPLGNERLFGDVSGLIDSARQRAAVAVNSELVMLYWSVGTRVRDEVLGGERAAYGRRSSRSSQPDSLSDMDEAGASAA